MMLSYVSGFQHLQKQTLFYSSGSWLGRAGDLRTMKWNFHFRGYSFLVLLVKQIDNMMEHQLYLQLYLP